MPIGTYTVTFELASFKKAVRPNIIITTGFNAGIDQKLEIGQMTEEVTISAASPVVDTKKTTTGAVVHGRDPREDSDRARPLADRQHDAGRAVERLQRRRLAVRPAADAVGARLDRPTCSGTSKADRSPTCRRTPRRSTSTSTRSIRSRSRPAAATSRCSRRGLAINLVTKSGSNVFKGTFNGTFENDKMQGQNVTEELFDAGANGFLSGNPLKKIGVYSIEAGGPIKKDRLWYWGAVRRQDINVGITNFFDPAAGSFCSDLITAQKKQPAGDARSPTATWSRSRSCLSNDQTIIKDVQRQGELPAERGQQARLHLPERRQDPEPARRELDDPARGDASSSSATRRGASPTRRTSCSTR